VRARRTVSERNSGVYGGFVRAMWTPFPGTEVPNAQVSTKAGQLQLQSRVRTPLVPISITGQVLQEELDPMSLGEQGSQLLLGLEGRVAVLESCLFEAPDAHCVRQQVGLARVLTVVTVVWLDNCDGDVWRSERESALRGAYEAWVSPSRPDRSRNAIVENQRR